MKGRLAMLCLPLMALAAGEGVAGMACFSDEAVAAARDYDAHRVVAVRVEQAEARRPGTRNERLAVRLAVLWSDPPLDGDTLDFSFRNAVPGFLAEGGHYALLLGESRGEATAYAVLDRLEAPAGAVADRARECGAALRGAAD